MLPRSIILLLVGLLVLLEYETTLDHAFVKVRVWLTDDKSSVTDITLLSLLVDKDDLDHATNLHQWSLNFVSQFDGTAKTVTNHLTATEKFIQVQCTGTCTTTPQQCISMIILFIHISLQCCWDHSIVNASRECSSSHSIWTNCSR